MSSLEIPPPANLFGFHMQPVFLIVLMLFLCCRLWSGQGCRDGVTAATRYHSSADSLLIGSLNSADTVECVDDCFVLQCNQIFIGMITMQYQAKQVGMSAASLHDWCRPVVIVVLLYCFYASIHPSGGHRDIMLLKVVVPSASILQCFDTVGWASGRAPGL